MTGIRVLVVKEIPSVLSAVFGVSACTVCFVSKGVRLRVLGMRKYPGIWIRCIGAGEFDSTAFRLVFVLRRFT